MGWRKRAQSGRMQESFQKEATQGVRITRGCIGLANTLGSLTQENQHAMHGAPNWLCELCCQQFSSNMLRHGLCLKVLG